MKPIIQYLPVLLLLFCLTVVTPSFSQEPPHPPATGHGLQGNQPPPGGSAPLDDGLSILLALGLAYGAKKVYTPDQETGDPN